MLLRGSYTGATQLGQIRGRHASGVADGRNQEGLTLGGDDMDVLDRPGRPGLEVGTDSPGFPASRLSVMGRHPSRAMALILLLALMFWLWFGLTQRSIISDDGLSIVAAQGVLEHGVMRLPSEVLYHRGYIPHYMLAASIYVLGTNDLAIMLPSILFALGSLWLTYLFSRDVFGRPWVGVLASLILLMLEAQTFYATSARMYMALEFFTMLAAYSAWRGYVQGIPGYRVIAVLSLAAVLLSNRTGASLFVAIPISVLAAMWLNKSARPKAYLPELGAITVLAAVVAFMFLFQPSVGSRSITPQQFDMLGWHFDPMPWAIYFWGYSRTAPYVLMFIPVALVALTGWRRLIKDAGLVYSLLTVGVSALILLLYVRTPAPRFWLNVVPIYAVIVGASIAVGAESYGGAVKRWVVDRSESLGVALWPLAGAGIVALLIVYVALGAPAIEGVAPCQGKGLRCQKTIEEHYAYLRTLMRPGDVVISTNPIVTKYYLGRVDGFLREKKDREGAFAAFAFPTDEYLGIQMIDTLEELEVLLHNPSRVWVVADPKVKGASSDETRRFLQANFARLHHDDLITTYINYAWDGGERSAGVLR